mgnify:CR=1 FL=1
MELRLIFAKLLFFATALCNVGWTRFQNNALIERGITVRDVGILKGIGLLFKIFGEIFCCVIADRHDPVLVFVFCALVQAYSLECIRSSTTLTLALGDALAITLLKQKGFSKEDFFNFHPGGKLGAPSQLELRKVSCICVLLCVYTCMYVYQCICVYWALYVCVYVCIYMCMYISVYNYICICNQLSLTNYTHLQYTYTHPILSHIYIHIYIYRVWSAEVIRIIGLGSGGTIYRYVCMMYGVCVCVCVIGIYV